MSEWISIEDMIPESKQFPSELVLVACNDQTIHIGYSHKGLMKIQCSHCKEGRTVTHWMPLPNPPEENGVD